MCRLLSLYDAACSTENIVDPDHTACLYLRRLQDAKTAAQTGRCKICIYFIFNTIQGLLATAMSVLSPWLLSECSGVIYNCHMFYDTAPLDCVTFVMPLHSFYNLAKWL